MKTLTSSVLYLILSAIFSLVNAQPTTQPIKIVNETNCDLYYVLVCTENGCETDDFVGGDSGTLLAHQSTNCSRDCDSNYEIAGLRFSFSPPTGTGATHYITFSNLLGNQCAGYEECNNL